MTILEVQLALGKRCPLGWRIKQQSRNGDGLIYIVNGAADYIMPGRRFSVKKDDILYVPRGCSYETETYGDIPFSVIVLNFLSDDGPLPLPDVLHPRSPGRLYALFSQIEETWFSKQPYYQLLCKAMLYQLIYALLCEGLPAGKVSANIQATIDYMENYYDQKVDMDQLALIAGYSPSHYRTVFKRLFGCPPVKYLTNLRVERAKDMLKSRLCTLEEVAFACGFSDVPYFCRVFKKVTGQSPAKF